MRQRKMAALAIALVAATGLTACGYEGGDEAAGGSGEKITIGIKYDQPGLGVQGVPVSAARGPYRERPGEAHLRDVLDHRRP